MAGTEDAHGESTVTMIRLATSFYAEMLKSPLLYSLLLRGADGCVDCEASCVHRHDHSRGSGYPAAELQRLHAHLDIDNGAFDELLAILDRTLLDYGMSGDTSSRIHATFDSFRDVIVR